MKSWTASKTVRLNLLVAICGVIIATITAIQQNFELPEFWASAGITALAAINLFLRWLTDQPITTARIFRGLDSIRGPRIDKIQTLENRVEAQNQQISRLLER